MKPKAPGTPESRERDAAAAKALREIASEYGEHNGNHFKISDRDLRIIHRAWFAGFDTGLDHGIASSFAEEQGMEFSEVIAKIKEIDHEAETAPEPATSAGSAT